MLYQALAVDFDGTLATEGQVSESTCRALERLAATGRRLLLITGRELNELMQIFPQVEIFHRVVAENGALLYRPASGERRALGSPPPDEFLSALRRHGVPFTVGHSIVATVHPYEDVVVQAIGELGLELNVVFNKGAVMVLPQGLNKATGLACALEELDLSLHNTIAVGDGENDHAMLAQAEFGVAVANSVPALKSAADRVTGGPNGEGVAEVAAILLQDVANPDTLRPRRRRVLVGHRDDGSEVSIPAACSKLLITGPAGSGKSVAARAVLERLMEQSYQCCMFDARGRYERFDKTIIVGRPDRPPAESELLAALEKPDASIVVNLSALAQASKLQFLREAAAQLQTLRARSGRPHWIVVDDAHDLLPRGAEAAWRTLAQPWAGLMCVAEGSDRLAAGIKAEMDVLLTIQGGTEGLVWERTAGAAPVALRIARGRL